METKTTTRAAEDLKVLRVRHGGLGTGSDGRPQWTFSVTLNRPAGGELGIVATAVDPHEPKLRIPAVGDPHPTLPGFIARPPEIHAVGLREKDGGAMIANESCFYNVVVRYEACSVPVRAYSDSGIAPDGATTNEGSARP